MAVQGEERGLGGRPGRLAQGRRRTTHVLLPSHCCCRLDTYRTTPADKHRVIAAVAQHLQGWMKAMADDDGMGSLWSPPEFHEEA